MTYPTLTIGTPKPKKAGVLHEYDLFIESSDGIHAMVCHIVSSKDFLADMPVVWRTYRKLLESLSLPIWTLCGDGKRCSVTDLQRAMLPKSRIDGKARKAARKALGMRVE